MTDRRIDANTWIYFALLFLTLGPHTLGIICIMLHLMGVKAPRGPKKRKRKMMSSKRRLR